MKKFIILPFILFLMSCSNIKTSLPFVLIGFWEHTNSDNTVDMAISFYKDGRYKTIDYSKTPQVEKSGTYTYRYRSFHLEDASGNLEFDESNYYSFVYSADKEKGPLCFSLKSMADGINRVFNYSKGVEQ